MKKTIKINLSGIIFNIDDDAYEKLKTYLDTIGRHFSNKQESKEIIDDIEVKDCRAVPGANYQQKTR